MAAQQCLPTNKEKDAFGADYRVVNRAYNALSPDPFLDSFRFDYKWLSKVYESIKPVDTRGPLIWASVGAKTFPIWWYVAPTVINTFLEAYDFSGRKLVLFATSGSSGFGNTVAELQPSAPGAEIIETKVLSGIITEAKISALIDACQ